MKIVEEHNKTWTDDEGVLLLSFCSGDKKEFFVPDNFFTAETLRELLAAIRDALGEASDAE